MLYNKKEQEMQVCQVTIFLIHIVILLGFYSPYVNAASLHGSWTDELYDVNQQHIDLYIGGLYAESQTADLGLSINVTDFTLRTHLISTKGPT